MINKIGRKNSIGQFLPGRSTSAGIITMLLICMFLPGVALASAGTVQDFTGHTAAILCVVIFVLAYSLVIGEEVLHLRKSKPVIVAAGIIWTIVAIIYLQAGDTPSATTYWNLQNFSCSCWRP